MSSLLKSRTTSQNHRTTGEAPVYPVYSVFAFKSSTRNIKTQLINFPVLTDAGQNYDIHQPVKILSASCDHNRKMA